MNPMAKNSISTRLDVRPIHPFPARMAPCIALDELRNKTRALSVLDPMAGSGTTLVIAKKHGHKAIGFDVDPMAVILANAWCLTLEEEMLRKAASRVLKKAAAAAKVLRMGDAYPCAKEDDETRAFIRYWFDETNRRQLAALSREIRKVRDPRIEPQLWCAFSRMIITKQASVSLAMDLAHSRPHKVRERSVIHPFDRFLGAVEALIAAAPFKDLSNAGSADIRLGDARNLPVPSRTIDLVLTSPPYGNAIDYLRGHKFSLVWMGHTIRDLRERRATSIGTEVAAASDPDNATLTAALQQMGVVGRLPHRHVGILAKYVTDMSRVLEETARVLKPGGRAVFAVGDSTVRGVYVRNSKMIAHLAEFSGLVLESLRRRPIPDNKRYLPPPSTSSDVGLKRRMRTEVILAFRAE